MAIDLPMDNGKTANLILVALVRKLIDRNVLSDEDVRDLLRDAASGLGDIADDELTPQAAQAFAEENLIPAFLGPGSAPV